MDEEGATTDAVENAEFRFHTVGEQLLAARVERGLSLNDVAAQTRIPIRHLEALETSDFAALPGSTYSIGFAKSYARFVGLDDLAVAGELRAELAQGGHAGFIPTTPDYEQADPARVPPRWLAWSAAAIAVLGLIGYFAWRSFAFAPDVATETVAPKAAVSAHSIDKAAAAAPSADGAVVLTATDAVWIKIYDADNKRVYENEMKAGDSFTVPVDAKNPMIVTGRPQALQVTIGGKAVAPLGEADRTISDVGVSAAALLARTAIAPPTTTPDTSTPVTATGEAPATVR